MGAVPNSLFEVALRAAEEADIKLEMVGGLPVWEAMPSPRHQQAVDRIRASISRVQGSERDCGCYHYSDIAIRFSDDSFKRPDVSIYCSPVEPDDEATTKIPAAVVEVLSKGYEAKDLQVGLPFFLANGVRDVVILNPHTNRVIHARNDAQRELVSPVTLELECGCVVTV